MSVDLEREAAELMEARYAIALPTLQEVRRRWPEHVARYELAAQLLSDADGPVIDAACGCGYGTALLADAIPLASRVYGVERHGALLAYAQLHYRRPKVQWIKADLAQPWLLPIEDNTAAGFVSLETIEHLRTPHHLLSEACRVLRPGGLLMLSTPHRPQGSPHHKHEYELGELCSLLSEAGLEIVGSQVQSGTTFSPVPEGKDLRGRYLYIAATHRGGAV